MIFLSYAREDRRVALAIFRELDAEGIGCLLDPELVAGDPFWREAVREQFRRCDLMLCLDSVHSDRSPWVEQERRAFARRTMHVALDSRPTDIAPPIKETVLPRELVSRLRVLACDGGGWRKRDLGTKSDRRSERMEHRRREQRRLRSFLQSRSGAGDIRIDIEKNLAWSERGGIQLELARAGPSASGRAAFISVRPVTNAQYRAFAEATGSPEPPTWRMPDFAMGELPVTGVSWFEASAFAAWMGGGLPTQEEWANAARGRDAGRLFATASGEIDRSNACFGRPFGNTAPAPVSAYAPNPEGFFGLCGNSWDWCADRLGANRVIRGGGCMDAAAFCRVDSRYRNAPLDRDCCVGFRVKIAV